ncbi:MAG: hypothetical protein ACF8PN_15615 [Phycisphaerales bacterium]
MSVSGLIVSIDAAASDHVRIAEVIESIRRDWRVTIGDRVGPRVAVVLETVSAEEARAAWEQVNSQPGVARVDVVYVHFDDAESVSRTETLSHDDI